MEIIKVKKMDIAGRILLQQSFRQIEWLLSKSCILALLLLILITFMSTVIAQESDHEYSLQPVEIMVTGHRPGPRLWKVSNGDNALWIFAYLSPVPNGMLWESERVEEILAQSQEYLPLLKVNTSTSLSKELMYIPNKQKLKDILPSELYEQYKELKKEYFRFNRSIEKVNPIYVAANLTALTFKKSDLDSGAAILRKIEKLASRNRALIRTEIITEPPKDLQDEFQGIYNEAMAKVTPEEGIACFTTTLKRVKPDVEIMRQRANAWATGDIGELMYLSDALSNRDDPCQFSLDSDVLNEYVVASWNEWLAAIENSLQHNRSTFAVLRLSEVLNVNGILNALSEKGYDVQVPR